MRDASKKVAQPIFEDGEEKEEQEEGEEERQDEEKGYGGMITQLLSPRFTVLEKWLLTNGLT